jgi:hypothetical protein
MCNLFALPDFCGESWEMRNFKNEEFRKEV